eukprot:scaffold5398_cov70-Skeletonema_marinoi.AAC.8
MSSDGILHQRIHSLWPSRVYLLQDMSSYMLTNVSDRDLLLDKCSLPPRLHAIFVTDAVRFRKRKVLAHKRMLAYASNRKNIHPTQHWRWRSLQRDFVRWYVGCLRDVRDHHHPI